jgi:hypothetical protein
MTAFPYLFTLVCLFLITVTRAEDKPIPKYITIREITTMPPREATLTKKISVYSGLFTVANVDQFILGSDVGDQAVWHFLGTLKIGQICKMPEAFLNYIAAPNYGTANEIAAMPPKTGTVVQSSPCSTYFTTADGKGFSIGNPGSGSQITHFLQSLESGRSYKLPNAFLDFQKQNSDKNERTEK